MNLIIVICLLPVTIIAGDLKIGAAAVQITPPVGAPMSGYYYERNVERIHDDLYAKALVIEKDGAKVAIISCDLIGIPADFVAEVRGMVEESTGIDADHLMIGATHTHTGPVISFNKRDSTIGGKNAQIKAVYRAKLPGLIAESVIQANKALKPANISFGLGHEESISFNRRFYMKDGTVSWNPRNLASEIIKPAGQIDQNVSVLYAETPEGKPILTYVNFALHLDNVGGSEISADFPHVLSNILEKMKGEEMVTIFSQGCSGNVVAYNARSSEPQIQYSQLNAQRIGTVLSGEVIKIYTRLQQLEVNKITVKKEIVYLPLPEISNEELTEARDVVARFGTPKAAPAMASVKAFKILDVFGRNGKPIETEVQIFALGDKFAIVSLPGEIFAELGIYIKERSLFPYTMIVELANGSIGYVPDRKAYIEGNYEPISSKCAPGSGEILAEKVLNSLSELKKK